MTPGPKLGVASGAIALSLLALPSCSTPAEAGSTCSAFGTTSSAIHNGSRSQKFLELSPEELDAVLFVQAHRHGNQVSCSGVLVDPLWVMTAKHCLVDGAHMWVRNATGKHPVAHVVAHPSADVALLALEAPLRGARPLRFGTEDASSYVNSKAEVAGYGYDADGVMGKLAFQVVTLIDASDGVITVTGDRSGACFGDSGAPLLSRASDGQLVVLGTLSGGAPSCTGIDEYVRADSVVEWLKTYFVPAIPSAPASCAELRGGSRCYGPVATFCDGDLLASERCDAPESCGYDAELGRFGCTRNDPCDGVDELGVCRENGVVRCEAGKLVRTECGCDESCAVSGVNGMAQCVPAN